MTYNFDYISTEFRDKLSSALSTFRGMDKADDNLSLNSVEI